MVSFVGLFPLTALRKELWNAHPPLPIPSFLYLPGKALSQMPLRQVWVSTLYPSQGSLFSPVASLSDLLCGSQCRLLLSSSQMPAPSGHLSPPRGSCPLLYSRCLLNTPEKPGFPLSGELAKPAGPDHPAEEIEGSTPVLQSLRSPSGMLTLLSELQMLLTPFLPTSKASRTCPLQSPGRSQQAVLTPT